MTGPQPDPLAGYSPDWKKAVGSSDPLADYHPAWRGQGDPNQKLHDEYASGRLAGRMARENTNDAEEAATPTPGYGERLATHVLNAGQGIPGVRAVEAAAGSLGSVFPYMLANGPRPMGYQQSLNTLDSATGNIGGKTSFLEKAMGGVATAPFLPAGAVKAGATLGAADAALSADPESLGSRALKTGVGAAIGGAVGSVADRAVTGVRAGLAPNSSANIIARKATRAASGDANYGAAIQGARPATPEVQAFLQQPDVAEIVTGLQQTRPFQGVAAEDPRMLDAVYKTLSDQKAAVKRGLDAPTPNRPNIGRFRGQDIGAAQNQFLSAVEAPGAVGSGAPAGMMPDYRKAVDTYAQQSRGIDAVRRGQDIIRTATGQVVATGKNLDRTTPQAFAEWVKTASPDEIQAVKEGILGATKAQFGRPGKTFAPARQALPKASEMLRIADPNDLGDILRNLGLSAANTPFSNR